MYAVWKIGAVVLPIDITLPESRIDYMISNSATRVILTNFAADKLAFTDCLVINTISDSKTEKKGKQIKYHYQSDRLAYILYTSGSTGLPKGVEVSQGALTNFIFNSLKAVSFPDKINMLATTSCSFDISISEMFWPLVVGGELTILNNIDSKNPEKICETIDHKHCNAIQTTPSRVQLLLQYKSGHSAFRNLTHMYLMGEVLSDNLVSEVQKVSDSEIFNCYGPTESTIWVSAKKIEAGQKITIGKPIENVQFYILKKNLTVAPLGTYGQLAIAGDSLAIGYRNNGKLTSKSFVRLGAPINQRVYLTGDLARLNDEGEVEVVGRIDNQIKINGVRIELEEIVPSSRKYPFISFKAEREIGNDLLTVENLSVKIDGETILDNINFILRPGDKTALIGQNDIQTTALIRALMGDIEYEGTVKWGVTTSQSYLPKDNSRDFASGESILDWLRQFASKEEDDNTFLRGFLGRMLFSGDEVNKSVNVLSGGEKVRVMLSKLMLLKSNVLVLDDPTNHLDLESISSLNDGLKNFKGSIIFASHDHEFIQTLANHIIVLSKNGVIDRIDETYDEFLENQEVQAKVKELWKD